MSSDTELPNYSMYVCTEHADDILSPSPLTQGKESHRFIEADVLMLAVER